MFDRDIPKISNRKVGRRKGAVKHKQSINNRAYEFSFAWIFSVFIGGMIIFLAIYAVTKIIGVERTVIETEAGKEITILLNPLQTNLEESVSNTITVSDPTRIFNECKKNSVFGSQSISVSIKSDIGQDWFPLPGGKSTFKDRYLFSADESEGNKKFYLISKPFYFPFKVADIIVMWSDKEEYCFLSPFDGVRADIEELGLTNKGIKIDDCSENSKKVCFPTAPKDDCDIIIQVSGNTKKVIQGEDEVYYVESIDEDNEYPLLYAAIFSSPEQYKCQIRRIMGRAAELGSLNSAKVDFLLQRGCGAALIKPDLVIYSQKVSALANSEDTSGLREQNLITLVNGLGRKNEQLAGLCKVF